MTTINESSRRAFLAALAASGATAAVVAGPGVAHAAVGDDGGVGSDNPGGAAAPSVLRTEAFPAPTQGTNYTFILGGDFEPIQDGLDYSKSFGEVRSLTGGVFYFALHDLPPGAVITEVTLRVLPTRPAACTAPWTVSWGRSIRTRSRTTRRGRPATVRRASPKLPFG